MCNQHIYSDENSSDALKNKARSQYLTSENVNKIADAAYYLKYSEFGYNKFITINLDWGGISQYQDFISKFLNAMQKWHRRHNIPFRYFWVLENVDTVGVHVHLLIHTDFENFSRLDNMITRWLPFKRDDMSGKSNTNIKIKNIYDYAGLISYLCKGLREDIEHECVWHKDSKGRQGRIYGRRWGMSHCKIYNHGVSFSKIIDKTDRPAPTGQGVRMSDY